MTYRELYEKAEWKLEKGEITLGEFDEMTKPLDEEIRPHDGWVECSDRLPTAENGERVLVHLSFSKSVCEYVYIPWKTVGFEYQVGHIDAWFAIPKYKETEESGGGDDEK